jgi:hypothetical protein
MALEGTAPDITTQHQESNTALKPHNEGGPIQPASELALPQSVTELFALAARHPGVEIKGLGMLPEASPLKTPHRALARIEGSPDPDILDHTLMLEREYNQQNLANLLIHQPGSAIMLTLQEYREGKPASEAEIKAAVARHILDIRSCTQGLLPHLEQKFDQFRTRAINEHRANYQASRASLITAYETKLQRRQQLLAQEESDQQAFDTVTKCNEEQHQQELKELESKFFNSYSSPEKYTFPTDLSRAAEDIHPTRDQTNEILEKTSLFVLGEIYNQMGRQLRQLQESIRSNFNASPLCRIEDTSQINSQQVGDIIQKSFSQLGAFWIDQYPELVAEMHTRALNLIQQQLPNRNSFFNYPAEGLTTDLLQNCNLPPQLIMNFFDQTAAGFLANYDSADTAPEDLYQAALQYRHDLPGLNQYIAWRTLADPNSPSLEALMETQEYYQRHRGYDTITDPESYASKKRFIGGAGYETSDRWSQESQPLNTQLINPALPSSEAINEIAARSPVEINSDPRFNNAWHLVSTIVELSGISKEDWHHWVLATKKLGVAPQAARFRNSNIGFMISPAHRKGGTGHFLSAPKYANNTSRQFPGQEEILSRIIREDEPGIVGRNHGIDHFSFTAVPIRIDRELDLGKYQLDPSQWIDIYAAAYREMKNDYFRDSSPDSSICTLRTSLLSLIAGAHEQHYKSHQEFSHHRGDAFDELDLIMFLPAIAAENNNDPSLLLIGYKALLQMDPSLRERYIPEIQASLNKLISQSPQLEELQQCINRDLPPMPATMSFAVNCSNLPQRALQQAEDALEIALRHPETVPQPFYFLTYYIVQTDKSRRNGSFVRLITPEEFQAATKLAPDTVINNRQYKGSDISHALEFLITSPDNTDDKYFYISSVHGTSPASIRESLCQQYHLSEEASNQAHIVSNIEHLWNDPDIGIDPKTLEFAPLSRAETILPQSSSFIERTAQSSPETALLLKEITDNPENTNLKPLVSAAELVKILTGEKLPPDNISELLRFFDQVTQAAVAIRGASRAEKIAVLDSLKAPLSPDQLTSEGLIGQLWQASGYLERERIPAAAIAAISAAFRISVARAILKIEETNITNLEMELMSLPDYNEDTARKEAIESIAFAIHRPDAQSFTDRAKTLFESLKEANETINTGQLKRDFLKQMGLDMANVMHQLQSVTDYQYQSTHWLQLMDQLFSEEGNEAAFTNSEGRLNMYCIQASFLYFELLQDLFAGHETLPWHQPMAIHIAREDQDFNLSLDQYYNRLTTRALGIENPDDQRDSYDHNYIFIKLPQIQDRDRQFYVLLDQTEGAAKIFSQAAVEYQSENSLIINNAQTHSITSKPEAGKAALNDKVKIQLTPQVNGQPLTVIAGIMSQSPSLQDYCNHLDSSSPHIQFEQASNSKLPTEQRLQAFTRILRSSPYFIGSAGFSLASVHQARLNQLTNLAAQNDLPIAGLFVAHTASLLEEKSDAVPLTQSFIEQCALLNEPQWKSQKRLYGHLLLDIDQDKIEQRRAELKAESEAARHPLRHAVRQTIAAAVKTASAILDQMTHNDREKEFHSLIQQADLPGSKLRAVGVISRINQMASAINEMHTSPQQPTFVGKVTTLNTPDQQQLTLRHRAPLKLSRTAASQAADYLVANLNTHQLKRLLVVAPALWRTFIHDPLRSSPEISQDTWDILNQSISAAAKKAGLDLPGPGQPLGDMTEVLELTRNEILNLLHQDKPWVQGNKLNSATTPRALEPPAPHIIDV